MGESLYKISLRILVSIFLIGCLLQPDSVSSITIDEKVIGNFLNLPPEEREINMLFPLHYELIRGIRFWEDVFTKYSTDQIIIHHAKYPDLVYVVINSNDPPDTLYRLFSESEWDQIDAAKDEVKSTLLELDEMERNGNLDPAVLPFDQKMVYGLFSSINEKHKFKNAARKNNLRAQRGQKDSFSEAIRYSGFFNAQVRKILTENGVPEYLFVLPFIESMYYPNAVSAHGAVGPWQLLKSTAKANGLTVNESKGIDERRDPIMAAKAAANKLSKEYDSLKRRALRVGIDVDSSSLWPLTIMAYNFGITRARAAIKRVKSIDVVEILNDYHSRYKGFAVVNFYPEFRAALNIYRNREIYFPDVEPAPAIHVVSKEYTLPSDIKLEDFSERLGIDAEVVRFLNPSLGLLITSGLKSIPKRTTIRIPYEIEGDVYRLNLAKFEKYHQEDNAVVVHKVRRNETLSDIAVRYDGINWKDIQEFNGLPSSVIRPGDLLQIPLEQ